MVNEALEVGIIYLAIFAAAYLYEMFAVYGTLLSGFLGADTMKKVAGFLLIPLYLTPLIPIVGSVHFISTVLTHV